MYQTLRLKSRTTSAFSPSTVEALNALNSTVIGDLEQAMTARWRRTPSWALLIITGEGRSFVAGADIGEQLPGPGRRPQVGASGQRPVAPH